MSGSEESDLTGGFVTDSVKRQGWSVKRTAHPFSPQVHRLLDHLRETAPGVGPVPISLDMRAGVETVSYLDGTVLSGGASPRYLWAATTLTEVAKLLRKVHDATSTLPELVDGLWQPTDVLEPMRAEVVCHNDIAPWNTVFRDELPVAFIDWDTAFPGARIWDVAYALWHFVPFYGEADGDPFGSDVGQRGERARIFCEAYGIQFSPSDLVETILRRQREVVSAYRRKASDGEAAYIRLLELGADRGVEKQIGFVETIAERLLQELSSAST